MNNEIYNTFLYIISQIMKMIAVLPSVLGYNAKVFVVIIYNYVNNNTYIKYANNNTYILFLYVH